MLDSSTLTQSTDALKGITDNLDSIILFGTIASIIFIAFYVLSVIRKRKVEKSTIQMQKDIHELLEIERSKIHNVQTPEEDPDTIL